MVIMINIIGIEIEKFGWELSDSIEALETNRLSWTWVYLPIYPIICVTYKSLILEKWFGDFWAFLIREEKYYKWCNLCNKHICIF